MIEQHNQYEVHHIKDVKQDRKQGKFLLQLRWKGYSKNQDTWEPLEHLNPSGASSLLNNFIKNLVFCYNKTKDLKYFNIKILAEKALKSFEETYKKMIQIRMFMTKIMK